MKMMYNGAPIKSLNIKHYEMSTNDCDMIASDLQVGKTAVAKGRKITGTGKAFEFAMYGALHTNAIMFVPDNINIIEVASTEHPIRLSILLESMKYVDFSSDQKIGVVIIEGVEYDLIASVKSNILMVSCEKDIQLQVFFGKDNYT